MADGKIKNSLSKTKEGFGQKLAALFRRDKIGEEFYDELTDILIASDVGVKTAMRIVDDIRDRAIEEKVRDRDYVVELLKESLSDIFYEADELEMETPAVIMVIGVNGVGKTTTIGKLAKYFSDMELSVTIAAADTFRAAAADQLTVWAERAGVRIVKHAEGSDPAAVVYDAVSSAKAKGTDVLIIDTAGRLHVKSNLMEELKKMGRVVEREYPDANFYKLIVLDATTGQNAMQQVAAFDQAVELDGVVLTKLDGTAKGGFVISLAAEQGVPVLYVGTGEKVDDIDAFDAEEFIDGIF